MLSRKGSNYELRKSRQDIYESYRDDEQGKDIGPTLTTIRDEEDDEDKIDSPLFPAAFSPTLDGQQNGKTGLSDAENLSELYAKVIPKAQRPKLEKSLSEDDAAPVTNGEVSIAVETTEDVQDSQRQKDEEPKKPATKQLLKPSSYSLRNEEEYATVVPRSERQKNEARSKVLSAIGNQPVAVSNGDDVSYHQTKTTANRITSALGNGVHYKDSAEL